MKRRRFDSDDDEDEYLASSEAPLTMYASNAGGDDRMLEMGLMSSPSASGSRATSTENVDAPVEPTSTSRTAAAAAVDGGCQTKAPKARAVQLSSQTRSDQDVPDELNQLLSDALLAVYQTPLIYAQSRRQVDHRLLAQYQPGPHQRVHYGALADINSDNSDTEENDGVRRAINCGVATWAYKNPYGISPGWRWDGVVRGRKHV